MPEEPFLRPRLVGPRFDSGIPFDMLNDLESIRVLITAIAKQRYLEEHPGRKRAPKGFRDGAFLSLTGVERGSAIAVIDMITNDSQYGLPKFSEDTSSYFKVARDDIVDAIASAAAGKSIDLSPEFLRHFDRIGRNLREEESIDFGNSSKNHRAVLDKKIRRKLVVASQISEITDPVRVRAYVPEMNQKSMTLELQLINGKMIPANLSEQHFDFIRESFNAYRNDRKVLISGIGKYDYHGNLKKIDSIDDVSALEILDVPSQLEELKSLKSGWMDGEGESLDARGLDWLADCFELHYPEEIRLPYIFPKIEGSVIAEWSIPPNEISLDIDLENRKGNWYVLNMLTDAEEREDYDLLNEESWMMISEKIAEFDNE